MPSFLCLFWKRTQKVTFPLNKMPWRTTISTKKKKTIKFPSIQIREREETRNATQKQRDKRVHSKWVQSSHEIIWPILLSRNDFNQKEQSLSKEKESSLCSAVVCSETTNGHTIWIMINKERKREAHEKCVWVDPNYSQPSTPTIPHGRWGVLFVQ